MKFFLAFIIISLPTLILGQSTDSFIVDISDQKIMVTSPAKKIPVVSIIIRNQTVDRIISEIRSENKVIKRFVLKGEGKEVIQIDFSKIKKLYYVPVSPPFEAAELKFAQRPYEIPPKD